MKIIQVRNKHDVPWKFTGVAEFHDGTKWWYVDGKIHRDNDLPACEYANGTKQWWRNDKLHRENGPAVEYLDGSKSWYLNGKLHRADGPAIDWSDGTVEFWYEGVRYETFEDIQDILAPWGNFPWND